MQYIAIKRFKRPETKGISGRKAVNIPYGSALQEMSGTLYYGSVAVCTDHSAVMREYFARNDDGLGLERGKLSHAIINTLQIRNGETRDAWNKRWKTVWNDPICLKYKKDAQDDYWLWAIEFFNAPMEDLKYIAALVGADREED